MARKTAPRIRRSVRIIVYVTPDQHRQIMDTAGMTGLTLSTFAKNVCLGLHVESREDQHARRELLKVNADLGRLGGLLKQTLAVGHKEQMYDLLRKLDQLQADLKAKIRAL